MKANPMIGKRQVYPVLRPFPVWKYWEVEVGVWRWCPDWYAVREVPSLKDTWGR